MTPSEFKFYLRNLIDQYRVDRSVQNGSQWGHPNGTSFDDFYDWLNDRPTTSRMD